MLFSWLGSRCLLGEGERAYGCLWQLCAVLVSLAVILWEPGARHYCVGLPVVPRPHSSANWLVEITCRSCFLSPPWRLWWPFQVCDCLSRESSLFSLLLQIPCSHLLLSEMMISLDLLFHSQCLALEDQTSKNDRVYHRIRNTTHSHVLWMLWQPQHFWSQQTIYCYLLKEEA